MSDTQKNIDPELKRQLEEAGDTGEVEVVLTLRSPTDRKYLTAQETQEKVTAAIAKLEEADRPQCVLRNVFPNLQSFVVSGPSRIVKAIMDDVEVAAATANRQAEELLIKPVKKVIAKGKDKIRRSRQQ